MPRALRSSAARSPSDGRLQRGNRRKREILGAAVDLASELGLGGLSIALLADHTGMSKSGLFAHFGSKEELQLATIGAAAHDFDERVLRPPQRVAAGLPRLRAMLTAWIDYARFASRFRLSRSRIAEGQRLFWLAHQQSLYLGIARAESAHPDLPETEQRFIDEVVLHNVNYAALSNDMTYLDTVGLFAFLVYPSTYPASEGNLDLARGLLIEQIPLSASHGESYADVGLDSMRWRAKDAA